MKKIIQTAVKTMHRRYFNSQPKPLSYSKTFARSSDKFTSQMQQAFEKAVAHSDHISL